MLCPPGFTKVSIYCYWIDLQRDIQEKKKAECEAKGGYLTKIGSNETQNVLYPYIQGTIFHELLAFVYLNCCVWLGMVKGP